jgi:hypothetical protein
VIPKYLAKNVLAKNFVPLRKQIYSRYVKFFQHLFTSTSKQIRHLARIVSLDARSTVYKNVKLKFIQELSVQEASVPGTFSTSYMIDSLCNSSILLL